MKIKYILIITISLIIIIALSVLVFKGTVAILNGSNGKSYGPVPAYESLFNQQTRSKLKFVGTARGKGILPLSNYIFDNKYHVFIYSALLTEELSLEKIIDVQNKSSSTMNGFYSSAGENYDYKIKMKSGKIGSVKSVQLNYEGEIFKAVKIDDNMVNFYLKYHTWSISYNNDSYFLLAKANHADVPASILFLKKGKYLNIINLTLKEGEKELPEGLLLSLIAK